MPRCTRSTSWIICSCWTFWSSTTIISTGTLPNRFCQSRFITEHPSSTLYALVFLFKSRNVRKGSWWTVLWRWSSFYTVFTLWTWFTSNTICWSFSWTSLNAMIPSQTITSKAMERSLNEKKLTRKINKVLYVDVVTCITRFLFVCQSYMHWVIKL